MNKLEKLIELLADQNIIGKTREFRAFGTDEYVPTKPDYRWSTYERINEVARRVQRLYDYFGLEEVDVTSPKIQKKKKSKRLAPTDNKEIW